jgi:hypothetical protein
MDYKESGVNTLANLDKFLERLELTQVIQEEMEDLNGLASKDCQIYY